MRLLRQGLCLAIALGWLAPLPAAAEATLVAAEHHPWGCFRPGAWRVVRVITETMGEDGEVSSTSTTETRTTLQAVNQRELTLLVEVTVEAAGKRFDGKPQVVRQGFHGEPADSAPAVTESDGEIVIEGRRLTCRVLEVAFELPGTRTLTKIHYVPGTPPYILRSETATTETGDGTKLTASTMTVHALDMPFQVAAEIKPTSLARLVQTHGKGTTVTWSFSSAEVPGGVIYHTSKEWDAAGRTVRRSVLELIDYGYEPEPEEQRSEVLWRMDNTSSPTGE